MARKKCALARSEVVKLDAVKVKKSRFGSTVRVREILFKNGHTVLNLLHGFFNSYSFGKMTMDKNNLFSRTGLLFILHYSQKSADQKNCTLFWTREGYWHWVQNSGKTYYHQPSTIKTVWILFWSCSFYNNFTTDKEKNWSTYCNLSLFLLQKE